MENYSMVLIEKAHKSLNRTMVESEKISKDNITNLMNTEFNFGKFHAYMDILKENDFEAYIKIAESTKLQCNSIMCNIENAYL